MPLSEKLGGFLKWANEHANFVGKHAKACDVLTDGIPVGLSIVENFGGAGTWSTILANKLQPASHRAFDIDHTCLEQLQNLFQYLYPTPHDLVTVEFGDAVDTIGAHDCDLAVLDFPSKTVNHYPEFEAGWKRLLEEVQPEFVIWTDLSFRYLHTRNNQRLYSRLMGYPVTDKFSYVTALSIFMYNKHGYSITDCAWNHISCSVKARRVPLAPVNFIEVNDAPPIRRV